MNLKERIETISQGCKRIYTSAIPYFFSMFLGTYMVLCLFREFCGPWLLFILSVAFFGFGLWIDGETLKQNFIAMLVLSIAFWLFLMCLAFIIRVPIIGEGCMLAISVFTAAQSFLEYTHGLWEREQIKYLI